MIENINSKVYEIKRGESKEIFKNENGYILVERQDIEKINFKVEVWFTNNKNYIGHNYCYEFGYADTIQSILDFLNELTNGNSNN